MLRAAAFIAVGMRNFGKDGFERQAKLFDNSTMKKRHTDKAVMVTGANQGLGYAIAHQLAVKGCTVYLVCRNEERGKEAISTIKAATSNDNVHLEICDLASLASIKSFAEQFNSSNRKLDVLINNAGGLWSNGEKSADGFELNFAVNTLGTYALTKALKPCLLKTGAPNARVIFISSGGMLTEPLVTDNLQGEDIKSTADLGTKQYARDKRRQMVLAERWASEWKDQGILCVSMHPGWAETDGVKTSIPSFYNTFKNSFRSVDQGADTAVWLAVEDATKIEPGAFYLDRRVQDKHLPFVGGGTKYKPEQVDELIAKLEAMMTRTTA